MAIQIKLQLLASEEDVLLPQALQTIALRARSVEFAVTGEGLIVSLL
jgi:hypothetical protein